MPKSDAHNSILITILSLHQSQLNLSFIEVYTLILIEVYTLILYTMVCCDANEP